MNHTSRSHKVTRIEIGHPCREPGRGNSQGLLIEALAKEDPDDVLRVKIVPKMASDP
jgi:hypothetical protein